MKPQTYIFIGRYGSGKGTQAKLLLETLKKTKPARKVICVETGAEFRKFMSGDGFTAKHSKAVVERGFLMPVFMSIYVWGKHFIEEFTGQEHIIFDGTPRKLLEAKVLEDLFPFYNLEKPWVICLNVKHEESDKRLMLRARSSGRADDGAEEIENRKAAYETDVPSTIEWYKTNPNVRFLDIDGERSIKEIHADIVRQIGLE